MSTEDEILKTLQRMEKILKDSSRTSGGSIAGGADKTTTPRNAATVKSKGDQHILASTKAIDKLTVAVGTSSKAMLNFALRAQIGSRNLSEFNKKLGEINNGRKQVTKTTEVRKQAKSEHDKLFSMIAQAVKNANITVNVKGGAGGNNKPPKPSVLDEAPTEPSKKVGKVQGWLDDFFKDNKNQLLHNVDQAIDTLFKDVIGRGFTGSFMELSKNAALAGMSLKEYTAMMQESSGLVSRYGSFAQFDQALSKTSNKLAGLGIYGEEATKLSAAMMSSSQTLGVPMDQLSGAADAQVKMFHELRKTTGMTADGFKELVRDLQNSDVVQKELLGLAPAERAARQAQLMQTMAWGKQLGLSEQAAQELTSAMINQRKSTVKERFQQRGRLTQAMSLVGMDPGAVAEAAALAGKRMKTPEEERRFTELMGEYAQRTEEIKQMGGEGMQFQAETAEEFVRTSGLGQWMDAAGRVRAAQESGQQIQKDTGQQTNVLLDGIGKTLGSLEGISKSELTKVALGVVGMTAILFGLPARIGAAVAAAIKGVGGGGGGVDLPDVAGKPTSAGGGKAYRFGRGASTVLKAVGPTALAAGALDAAYGVANADEIAKQEGKTSTQVKSESIFGGLGSAIGGAVVAALSGALVVAFAPVLAPVAGIVAAVGGMLGAFGGGSLGKWFGGWITSNDKNTKATEVQNAETKKLADEIANRRATAGSSVVALNDLSGLGSNVARTAAAYSTVQGQTVAQVMPVQPAAKSVTSTDVNTQEKAEQKAAATAAQAVAGTAGSTSSQDVLVQILKVLQESLLTEERQVELAQQMLMRTAGSRSQADVVRDSERVLGGRA